MGACCMYLAGIEMPDDFDDDLIVLIRGLVSWHHHLSCCQILQLVHLGVGWAQKNSGCHQKSMRKIGGRGTRLVTSR